LTAQISFVPIFPEPICATPALRPRSFAGQTFVAPI
jgi:hypothetical protein